MSENKSYIYQEHLDKVRNELIKGESKYNIKRKLMKGEYEWWPESKDVHERTLYSMIAEAADTCKYETAAARDEAKAVHLERYLDLYRKCDAANDRTNARAILSDIAKLMGLNEKETIAIESTTYKVKLV